MAVAAGLLPICRTNQCCRTQGKAAAVLIAMAVTMAQTAPRKQNVVGQP
jgi:hypothetical protein